MTTEQEKHQQIEQATPRVADLARALGAAGYSAEVIGHVMVATGVNVLASADAIGARETSRILALLAQQYGADADRAVAPGQH